MLPPIEHRKPPTVITVGLGDVVAGVLKITGVEWLVRRFNKNRARPCNCKPRRAILNSWLSITWIR